MRTRGGAARVLDEWRSGESRGQEDERRISKGVEHVEDGRRSGTQHAHRRQARAHTHTHTHTQTHTHTPGMCSMLGDVDVGLL